MLCDPDALVAARDPLLPGLSTLLDADAFTALLRSSTPALSSASARPAYVRYKPGTRCLVAYHIERGGTVTHVYANAYSRARWATRQDPPARAFHDRAITIRCFPEDDKLRVLQRLWSPWNRSALLRKMLPTHASLHTAGIQTLAYKPERRYVGLLDSGQSRAVIKLYRRDVEHWSCEVPHLREQGPLRLARRIGRSQRHRAQVFDWVDGDRLSELLLTREIDLGKVACAGAALAQLHAQLHRSAVGEVPQYGRALNALARGLAVLLPASAARVAQSVRAATAMLRTVEHAPQLIHGDFDPSQVIVTGNEAAIVDLDCVGWGDRLLDIGNFLARLEYHAIDGSLTASTRDALADALISGYEETTGRSVRSRVSAHTALGLLRLAPAPFRTRHPHWNDVTIAMLDRVDALLARGRSLRPPRFEPRDPALPGDALDARTVERHLAVLAAHGDLPCDPYVRGVRIVHHKPGRRALVEYDLGAFTVVGKVRAKGADTRTFRMVQALWGAGFDDTSVDGVSVPQPLGVVPQLRMWLQRKVTATPVETLLTDTNHLEIARRSAEAIRKLHRTSVTPLACHSPSDELRILRERLTMVARERPEWTLRLDALFEGCRASLDAAPASAPRPIHRDFHPGQILVAGDRIFLIDFDLFTIGDPALDVGNFLAHVAEYSLRTLGTVNKLASFEGAMTQRFLELAPDVSREAVAAYRLASLARHVYISMLFDDRRRSTERLLQHCEALVSAGSAT